MFEQQYDELWAAVDLIAECIRSLGEFAPGSCAQFAVLASIAEAHGVPTAEQMLADLVSGHEAVTRTASTAFAAAETAGDKSTADLLTQRLQIHEKTAWMRSPDALGAATLPVDPHVALLKITSSPHVVQMTLSKWLRNAAVDDRDRPGVSSSRRA